MPRTKCILVFALLVCLQVTSWAVEEVLFNGNFELDDNGAGWSHYEGWGIGWWQWAGDKDYDATEPKRAPSWNQYIGCSGWWCNRSGSLGVTQTIPGGFNPGGTYVASGWFYYQDVATGDPTNARQRLRLVFKDTWGGTIDTHVPPWSIHQTQDGWDQFATSFDVPLGTSSIEFYAEMRDTDGQLSGVEAIDQLSMFPISELPDLMVNGDFEDGFAPAVHHRGILGLGWHEPLGNVYDCYTGYGGNRNIVHSGDYAQAMVVNWMSLSQVLYQQVPVTPGHTYTASCWAYKNQIEGTHGGGLNWTAVGIDPTGGTDGWSPDVVWGSPSTNQDVWEQQSVSTTTASATITIFLIGHTGHPCPEVWDFWYFDDVSLEDAVDGPVPIQNPGMEDGFYLDPGPHTFHAIANGWKVRLEGKLYDGALDGISYSGSHCQAAEVVARYDPAGWQTLQWCAGWITQSVPVVTGHTYLLTGWVKTVGAVCEMGCAGSKSGRVFPGPWQKLSVLFVAQNPAVTVGLNGENTNQWVTGKFYVDDVRLVDLTPSSIAYVTYDGDTIVSTGGAATGSTHLIATLWDEDFNIPDVDDETVTFTLTAEGVGQVVATATSVDGIASTMVDLEPGIYTVEVTLASCDVTTTAIVVVYNPEGGSATGGGWILPEDDGLNTYPDRRANFGFSAKYKSDSPTGHIGFRYSDGYVDLKSTSIELLVITGGKIAQFKGYAEVNGEEGHWFFAKAIDEADPGVGADTFEIKIWAPGVDPAGDPSERAHGLLCGGNILVHAR